MWTTELPTKPGLYAWCDGRGGCTVLVQAYECNGIWTREFGSLDNGSRNRGGLWQPITVELPAPYVPPKPPKVEVYSAKFRIDGRPRLLVRIGDAFTAHDPDDNSGMCGDGPWDEVSDMYTDIQRVPDEASH